MFHIHICNRVAPHVAASAEPGWLGRRHRNLRLWVLLSLGLTWVARTWAADPSPSLPRDRPILIIDHGGMNSEGELLHGSVDESVRPAENGFRTVHVRLQESTALMSEYDSRWSARESLERPPLSLKAPLENAQEYSKAARVVAGESKDCARTILHLDTDFGGKKTVVGKAFVAPAIAAASTLESQLTPSSWFKKDSGSSWERAQSFVSAHEIRTDWDRYAERSARFIGDAVREFKEKYPDGLVIAIGHSHGNEALDHVPTQSLDGKRQMIDVRVMASVRSRVLEHHDPEHTLFFAHDGDLWASAKGDIWNKSNSGDLRKEGTVVKMTDPPLSVPGMEAVLGIHLRPFDVHSTLGVLDHVFEGKIVTQAGEQPYRGTLWHVAEKQAALAAENKPVAETLIKQVEREKPYETPNGGVSLSKPAEVPLEPGEVASLRYEADDRFSFLMRSGSRVELPALEPYRMTEAAICIFAGDKVKDPLEFEAKPRTGPVIVAPEISLMPCREPDGSWWEQVVFKGAIVDKDESSDRFAVTHLADDLIRADSALSDIAFRSAGKDCGIPGFHNFHELSLDNRSTNSGRIWIVPARIAMEVVDGVLTAKECRIAVRFEAYNISEEEKYYAGKVEGWHDPAGDYLARQLTENFNLLETRVPGLKGVRGLAAGVGVLIWAKQNGIKLDQPSAEKLWDRWKSALRAQASPTTDHPWKERTPGCFLIPMAAPSDVKEADIQKPAVIFNAYGISRLLWEDGSASGFNYDPTSHLPTELVGRNGDRYNLVHNGDRELAAITRGDGYGVAAWSSTDPPVLAERVVVGPGASAVTSTRATTLFTQLDVPATMRSKIDAWITAERLNDRSENWLWTPPPVDWTGITILAVSGLTLAGLRRHWNVCPPTGEPGGKFDGVLCHSRRRGFFRAIMVGAAAAGAAFGGALGLMVAVAWGLGLAIAFGIRHRAQGGVKQEPRVWLTVLSLALLSASAAVLYSEPWDYKRESYEFVFLFGFVGLVLGFVVDFVAGMLPPRLGIHAAKGWLTFLAMGTAAALLHERFRISVATSGGIVLLAYFVLGATISAFDGSPSPQPSGTFATALMGRAPRKAQSVI